MPVFHAFCIYLLEIQVRLAARARDSRRHVLDASAYGGILRMATLLFQNKRMEENSIIGPASLEIEATPKQGENRR